MAGLETVQACLSIMTRLLSALTVNRKALKTAFTPAVFATDHALDQVLNGKSFREAYDWVKANLETLGTDDPVRALARKTHTGGTAGLDLATYRARIRDERKFVATERRKGARAVTHLMCPSV